MRKLFVTILLAVVMLSPGAYERGCSQATDDFDPRVEPTNTCVGVIRDSIGNNSIKVAVYQFGTIWRDTCRFPNKGWVQVYSNFTLNLSCAGDMNKGDTMFAAGNGGAFLLSSNSGNNWVSEPIPAAIQGNIKSASLSSKGAIALLTSNPNGSCIRTKAPLFGGSWQVRTIPTTRQVNSVKALWTGDANNFSCVTAGDSGTVLYSTNSGSSWVNRSVNTTKKISFIGMYSENTWIAGGSDSLLRITTDAGISWNPPSIVAGSWGSWDVKTIELTDGVSGYILAYDGSATMIRNIAVNLNTGFLGVIDFMGGLGVSGEIKAFTVLPDKMLAEIQNTQFSEGAFYKTSSLTAHVSQVEIGSEIISNSRPYILLPVNGSTVSTLTPVIKWSEMSDCFESDIQLSADSAFTGILVNQSTANTTSYTVPAGVLNYSTRYFWRARNRITVTGPHNSQWTETGSFRTPPPSPAAPVLISPLNNSTGISLHPVLDWSDVPGTDYYTLEVSTSSAFTSFTAFESPLSVSTFTITSNVLQNNTQYFWRVKAHNAGGTGPYSAIWNFRTGMVSIQQASNEIPKEFRLYNNYPNPFNPVTKIKFDIPVQALTNIIIYDITGKEIEKLINSSLIAGSYEVEFNAVGFSSGVYFYRITAGDFIYIKKMILVK